MCINMLTYPHIYSTLFYNIISLESARKGIALKKYRDALLDSIQEQFNSWFVQRDEARHEYVYRFLHTIKGSAATFGLDKLSHVAEGLLDNLKEENMQSLWTTEELEGYMTELIAAYHELRIQSESLAAETIAPISYSVQPIIDFEPTLLLIDDDYSLLMLLKDEMEKQGWIVFATDDAEQAMSFYYDVNPDCMITDLHMPGKNGYELLQFFNERMNKQLVPRVVISADQDRKTRMKCYEAGADDFISKPIDIEEFIVRITRQLNRKRMLDQLLLLDELTGAYNRIYLNQVMDHLLADFNRSGKVFSLAIIDLDFFKKVNDSFGHLAGDILLKGFVDFVKAKARTTDSLIRYGGEEFILIMPDTGAHLAKQLVDRLREQFAQCVTQHEDKTITATFSAGLIPITSHDKSVKEWIQLADQALYQAKLAGRNRVVTAGDSIISINRTIKVGIIDDDTVIRKMLVEFLSNFAETDMQFEITDYREGASFFDSNWHAGQGSYFIILDGNMPKMDGFEVLQRIRALPNADRFTIMMLTGRKNEKDIVRGLELGADDYLMKPFSIRELEARMRRLMKRMR